MIYMGVECEFETSGLKGNRLKDVGGQLATAGHVWRPHGKALEDEPPLITSTTTGAAPAAQTRKYVPANVIFVCLYIYLVSLSGGGCLILSCPEGGGSLGSMGDQLVALACHC